MKRYLNGINLEEFFKDHFMDTYKVIELRQYLSRLLKNNQLRPIDSADSITDCHNLTYLRDLCEYKLPIGEFYIKYSGSLDLRKKDVFCEKVRLLKVVQNYRNSIIFNEVSLKTGDMPLVTTCSSYMKVDISVNKNWIAYRNGIIGKMMYPVILTVK